MSHFQNPANDTASRIIQAVMSAWEAEGVAGTSIRTLAQTARTTPSSIYHHFGNIEHLYLTALDLAARQTSLWCGDRLAQLDGAGTLEPASLSRLLAAMIDDWARECRTQAVAWRECLMLSARDPRYVSSLHAFNVIWADFWENVCARSGYPSGGECTSAFFAGETSLHLMRWRSLIDRAALDETCDGWVAWLDGTSAFEGPWRRLARDLAKSTAPQTSPLGGTVNLIASVAADLVEIEGVAALTHRAVAAKAGLTLGVVNYHFRTSSELARAAFDAIYRRVSPVHTAEAGLAGPDRVAALELLQSGADDFSPQMLALDELMIATARNPLLSDFIPHLRYERGRTAGHLLGTLLDAEISSLDAAIFSSFVMGQRQYRIALEPEKRRAFSTRTLSGIPRLTRLL